MKFHYIATLNQVEKFQYRNKLEKYTLEKSVCVFKNSNLPSFIVIWSLIVKYIKYLFDAFVLLAKVVTLALDENSFMMFFVHSYREESRKWSKRG